MYVYAPDPELGTIALPVEEGRTHLWYKVRAAFTYIHQKYRNDADFFYKADDDTFVVPQNLRKILRTHSASDAIWMGCRFHLPAIVEANEVWFWFWFFLFCPLNDIRIASNLSCIRYIQGYMSGGSGYVLSRESLRRFVQLGLTYPDICTTKDVENEDIEIGVCMEKLNVTAIDTRDSRQRGTFMPFSPYDHLVPADYPDYWYWLYRYYGNVNDVSGASRNTRGFGIIVDKNRLIF